MSAGSELDVRRRVYINVYIDMYLYRGLAQRSTCIARIEQFRGATSCSCCAAHGLRKRCAHNGSQSARIRDRRAWRVDHELEIWNVRPSSTAPVTSSYTLLARSCEKARVQELHVWDANLQTAALTTALSGEMDTEARLRRLCPVPRR